MFSRKMVVAVCLAVGLCAMAQTTRPAEEPYVGILTGTRVHVRCGPGQEYYECIRLSQPDIVKVLGERDGWLMISPPKRCHSLVAKRFVQAVGDKGRATVDDLQVRAGSDLLPRRMDRIQGRLKKGDRVLIVGERGEYYKIAPPRGVVYWISAKYVKPAGKVTTFPAASRPAEGPTTREVIATTLPSEQIDRELRVWKAAEKAFDEEFKKPHDQRDLAGLLARYQAIKPAARSPLIGPLTARVEFIEGQIELAEDMRTVAGLVADVDATRRKLVADKARMKVGPLRTRRMFPAEGVLTPSGLFTGGATGPKRYIITAPDRRAIRAYVQCTTGVVDLAKHAGAHVRAIGTATYDEKLRMYVIEAEQIIVLRAPAVVPELKPIVVRPEPRPAVKPEPKPTVKPEPKPEPKPTVKPKPAPTSKPVTVKPKPAPKATSRPVTVKPKPAPKATSRPATVKPLPETGLPMVGTSTKPAASTEIDPKEYE